MWEWSKKSEIIDGSQVKVEDALIALGSSGPHSNGYSLIRKVIDVAGVNPATEQLDGRPLSEQVLAPTKNLCKICSRVNQTNRSPCYCALNRWRFLGKYPRVYYRKILKRSLMKAAGNGNRCSNGYKKKATLKPMKCTAHLTVAWAW